MGTEITVFVLGKSCIMVEPLDCNSHSTESLNPEETLEFDAMELGHEDKHEDALVDEGEGNGDSSEEASEEEGEYVFQFPGEMDPLAFAVEEDESGMQPYEQFEKIQQHHYESLAANKRGMTSTSGMPAAKRARREEEEIEASFEEIMEGMGCGRGRKSRKNRQQRSGRRKGSKNKTNPEVTRKLGEATLSRAAGRSEEKVFRAPPLPDLLKDEWHHQLILDLCKSLLSLERYWEALQIINLSLKLASKTLSVEPKKELQTLGAQIACHICDPALGWVYMRDIVARHPHSVSAWCCCYKIILRHSRELKSNSCIHNFRRDMRAKYNDSVPPILISGNLFTMFCRHQEAASEYLEAYKLMPDNPLINLCVGTALINLALDMRLQNKHQTALQGLAFLCNNVQLCKGSQESLYNIARAYHHIGMISLAVAYYEKVLEIHEKDYPVPLLPYEIVDGADDRRPAGYCDLRREAAYNLHLIYKNSGSYDLARQVLRDHVVL